MLKYELIPEQLLREGIIRPQDLHLPGEIDEEFILLAHAPGYWERMRDLKLSAAEIRRIGFPQSEELVERERRIAQGTIEGSLHALNHKIAFNVAGGTHHAGSNWGEGFCLLNDQAIAAAYLVKSKLVHRILIIDLDVHQGNGTAEIFSEVNQVFTFSMHAENNFPFRKEKSDLDIGLKDGTRGEEYLAILTDKLKLLSERVKPDFMFYLSGVDVLSTDKLGKLALSQDECLERDRRVFSFCQENNIPLQVSMGGGYSPELRHIVDAHCNTFRIARELYC
ncbi:MAG: histone deacetylase [Daejeonella sp.]|uniref:histone deacetylase family protein n=1 Tax=Daejeonella sp. TaxID=2805397 RepID=UPI003C70691C